MSTSTTHLTQAHTRTHRVVVGDRVIPVVPPSLRDPRLQVSAVVLSVHALGQLSLGFDISIAQIVLTLATCALIEAAVTLVRSGALIWPGSALLTAGGISLVLRVPGTAHGDWWSLHGWYWYVGVAAAGMATKYLIRYRGVHVFNPSNVALVGAFVLFGSGRVEPLDFWWGPLGWGLVAAYVVIVVGGLSVGKRLDLVPMAAAFWVTLAAGTALLAASGHSITARWSFAPVTGLHFWWIIVISPEVLIFLFFMITDPRTVPAGRVARVAFATSVGVVCTLLIAPQTTEFGAKVGLLGGLVIMCALRPWFDHRFPQRASDADAVPAYVRGVLVGPSSSVGRAAGRGAFVVVALAVGAAGIVVAGMPARPTSATPPVTPTVRLEAVDLAQLPEITIERRIDGFGAGLETPEGARALVETLAGNLSVEDEAILTGDAALLASVDHGDRLAEYQQTVADSIASGERTVGRYEFDTLDLIVVFPQGAQSGANAGVVANGTVEWITYGPDDEVVERVTEPLSTTFTLRPVNGDRWLTTDTLDPG